ncbi:MAG: 5-deoxy-glucuronate isomerase, partial [Spirochaetaceae bacterium]|nr:5-deoxy-glucuronate isomerase [Spirochaetaceae bacterium]
MSRQRTETTLSQTDQSHPRNWKYSSPTAPGFHEVISPNNSPCSQTWIFRLNLRKGEWFSLRQDGLELNAGIIAGSISVQAGGDREDLSKLDSFYLPAGECAVLTAHEDTVLYMGGGPYEGIGQYFVRRYEPDMPLGEIHQVHGNPPFQREIFMTLNQEVAASRLICGFTSGASGMWTSWPPHQHSGYLEEVYCYYDLPAPKFALHLSSRVPNEIEAVHPVSDGDFVIIPEGYHPTVAMPGA